MNNNNLPAFLGLIFLSLVTFCANANPLNNNDFSGGNKDLKTGQIVMKGYPDKNNQMSFEAAVDKITIDWGDGTVEKKTSNGKLTEFMHEYATKNIQTISIHTERLTSINFNSSLNDYHELHFGNCPELKYMVSSSNQLTSLDVSKCTALELLYCSFNQLTSLDVSKCTALKFLNCPGNQLTSLDLSKCAALLELNCRSNQLTSSALNSLFKSLPTAEHIWFQENPGESDCDKSIATNKGWKIN
jgi:hypothetical protein